MPSKWTHVWNTVTGKYVGFFSSRKDAEAWTKKQAIKDELEVNDTAPERRRVEPEFTPSANPAENMRDVRQAGLVDQGLDAALIAAKAEEANNAAPPTSTVD